MPEVTLLLTQQERDRFASYLEHEASTTEGMIAQMEKIKTPEVILRLKRTEAAACRFVANMLRTTESWGIEHA